MVRLINDVKYSCVCVHQELLTSSIIDESKQMHMLYCVELGLIDELVRTLLVGAVDSRALSPFEC
jgi:hypothetical protein